MARVRTRYVGVYTRTGKNRILPNGKPDRYFDVSYTINGQTIWEKVGWLSEGYRIFDAVELRAVRIREHRHQNLFVPPPSATPKQVRTRHGRQRHWFARFRRKSIVVSKTLEMIDLTMALFARFHVNGSWKDRTSLFS